ncbi:MAG: adenosylmethionine--8-amino-7-oxononanoate transaminase [Alphaproteobacteria bacterium]
MHSGPDPRLRHLWRPYTQIQTEPAPLVAVETDGARIRLDDGRWLIDGTASWWTAVHGYNHPHITAAIKQQIDAMPHVMFGGLIHEPALELGSRLATLLPGAGTDAALDHVFFSDSGSVAVEVALKMAVQFWRNAGDAGRHRIVAFRHAYHGDTMGAMSVCDPDDGMHATFRGYFPEQILTDLPRDAAARDAFDRLLADRGREVAAVIVEPLVQAAGGMKFHDPATLAAIAESCAHHDVLLIADEIATGFGRTGHLFACQAAGVVPDIICLGKALSGGLLSLAATAASARVFEGFLADDPAHALMHGPTFMANPLAVAAANASLDLFDYGARLDAAKALEAHFRSALEPCRALAGIKDVRALGAIGVVQMATPRAIDWLRARFVEHGVWVRPFGDVVYLMPPLIVTGDERTALTDAVVAVMTEWAGRK